MTLLEELVTATGVRAVDDIESRTVHSRDASVFQVMPQIIAYPKNVADISALVVFANACIEAGKPISFAVRAGGTCMSGGSLTESVLISMADFIHSVDVSRESCTAYVEMGAMYKAIETEASKVGLLFGAYTSSKDLCGIAGMIGNNASGEKSIRHGATIDNVIRVFAVLADGVEYEFGPLSKEAFAQKQIGDSFEALVYRNVAEMLSQHETTVRSLQREAVKCASGYRLERVYNPLTDTYNLSKLFVGSQGTIGIITRAELTMVPQSTHERLIVVSVDDLSLLSAVLQTVGALHPESVETYDVHTFDAAKTFFPDETAMVLPLFEGAGLIVLVQFAEDTAERTDMNAHQALEALKAHTSRVTYVDDARLHRSLWKIRRSSFAVLRDHVEGTFHAVPCIEDIIVPVSKFNVFIPELIQILQSRTIRYGFHGHIGDGALRIIPIFDMADPTTPERIVELCRTVFALVYTLGGNMSADHSDGIIRTPFLREFYGEEVETLFGAVKETFDPFGIFNPGKKVGGTIAAIEKYIVKG